MKSRKRYQNQKKSGIGVSTRLNFLFRYVPPTHPARRRNTSPRRSGRRSTVALRNRSVRRSVPPSTAVPHARQGGTVAPHSRRVGLRVPHSRLASQGAQRGGPDARIRSLPPPRRAGREFARIRAPTTHPSCVSGLCVMVTRPGACYRPSVRFSEAYRDNSGLTPRELAASFFLCGQTGAVERSGQHRGRTTAARRGGAPYRTGFRGCVEGPPTPLSRRYYAPPLLISSAARYLPGH
jgi:hypothetical protein